MQITC